jgi:Anthrone oxygenase
MSVAANGVGWVLILLFATLLGSHLFDTAVLVPSWSAKPPESVREWAGTPTSGKVVAHFRRLLPALLAASLVGLPSTFFLATPARTWLLLASLCGIAHMSLIVFFFIPTNRALGMLPSDDGSSPLEAAVYERLVEAWLRWNRVRIGCDLVGLIAAVQATT